MSELGKMFGSIIHMDSIVPRMQSKQIQKTSSPFGGLGSIKLDFAMSSRRGTSRRSSFLPAELADATPLVQMRHSSKSSYVYEGATVYKLEGDGSANEKISVKKFCTGSRYVGEYNELGIAGKGVYKFPHGVIYDGNFNLNGEFHGTGILLYPNGQKVEGIWRNGKLVKGASYVSNDNATLGGNQYCKMPDRRFQIEVNDEVLPAGQEYLTNAVTPRLIPKGMYDTGNGFYDPRYRVIVDYVNPRKQKTIYEVCDEEQMYLYQMLLEMTESHFDLLDLLHRRSIPRIPQIDSVPPDEKMKWITDNCRKGWDEPTRYNKSLYEMWTAGYKNDNLDGKARLREQLDNENDELIKRLSQINKPPERSTADSTLYSFILHNSQNILKIMSRRGSLSEVSSMFTPKPCKTKSSMKKTMFHHLKRRKPRSATASGRTSGTASRRSSYGMKLLMFPRSISERAKRSSSGPITRFDLPEDE